MNTDKKYKYVFTGQVHPTRSKLFLDHTGENSGSFRNSHNQNQELEFSMECNEGYFKVNIISQEELIDIETLKNQVKYLIETRFSYVGFTSGHVIESVEVQKCIQPDQSEKYFNLQMDHIRKLNNSSKIIDYRKVFGNVKLQPHIMLALLDFQKAMSDANNTHFHAYRAIECLRVYYAIANGLDPEDKKAWSYMHTSLGTSKDLLKGLTEKSQAIRHGQVIISSAEDNLESIELAWKMIKKFLEVNC